MNAPEAALYGQCVYTVLMHTKLQTGTPYHWSGHRACSVPSASRRLPYTLEA